MPQNNDTLAVMLLCCRLSATRQELFEPLSPQEFATLSQKLQKNTGAAPSWLLGKDIVELMKALEISEKEAHRLVVLMDRMLSLTYELESYAEKGIRILTCLNSHFPRSLRRRLGKNAPTHLYIAGNSGLFDNPTIAFAGSIPGDDELRRDTVTLCDAAEEAETVVVTSGTTGIDSVAEERICENGGSLIVWQGANLSEAVGREYLSRLFAEGRAAVVSTLHPDTPPQPHIARIRAKFQYATGTIAYVPGCEYRRGDTWEGASDALRHKYVTQMLCKTSERYSGNAVLIKRGAMAVGGAAEIDFAKVRDRWVEDEGEQISVFDNTRLLL